MLRIDFHHDRAELRFDANERILDRRGQNERSDKQGPHARENTLPPQYDKPMKHLLVAMLALSLLCGALAEDRSTPEKAVRGFISALNTWPYPEILHYVQGAKENPDLAKLRVNYAKESPHFELANLKIHQNGSSATASYVLSQQGKKTREPAFATKLVREPGGWVIVPSKPAPTQPEATSDWLGGIAWYIAHPSVAKASASKVACLSNVKQAALTVLMLAADNDDTIALKAADWEKSVRPYAKTDAIFACPDTKEHYAFNGALAGLKFSQIPSPSETVLIYEGKNGILHFAHEGMAVVGFADGHVKFIDAEQAKNLIWKP